MLGVARWITIAFALFSLALGVLELTGRMQPAAIGISIQPHALGAERILAVAPGSAGERAGLRAGERITFLDRNEDVRKPPGSIVRLRRDDGSIVAITIAVLPLSIVQIVQFVSALFFCVLGLAIALRAWNDVRARRLAWSFLWIVVEFADQSSTRWRGFDITLDFLNALTVPLGMAALVAFAATWPRTPAVFMRVASIIARTVAAGYALTGLATASMAAARRPISAFQDDVMSAAWTTLALLAMVSLIVSFRHAAGADRQRIGWILATFIVALGPLVIYEPLHAARPEIEWTWVWYTATILPFGLAYATLRHRVIDLGFALNRAAVFAATTLLIAGLFGGFQWTVNQLLSAETKREGFIVQLAVAVAVLYVVGFARSRTEAFVARAFFASRRRRIDAILRIADAVDAVDDPRDLAPLTIERLRTEAGIAATLIFDDAPLGVPSGPDIAVFPLRVRARNRGTLSCTAPAAGEVFAPDEHAALARLAASIAIAHALLDGEGARGAHAATAAASAE